MHLNRKIQLINNYLFYKFGDIKDLKTINYLEYDKYNIVKGRWKSKQLLSLIVS